MTNPATGAVENEANPLRRFVAKFGVLKNAIPELWLVFAIKWIVIAAYQLTNMTVVLWLENQFGYSDKVALHWVAAWAMAITVATLLVGSLTDAIGLRRTLFLGTSICVVARFIMVVATQQWLALSGGLMLLAIGEALTAPVVLAGVRRYSNTRQRSISFSLIYAIMNGGIFVAAWIFDFVRQKMGEHGQMEVLGFSISTYRTLFLGSLIIQLLLYPLILWLREGVEATDDGVKITPRPPGRAGHGAIESVVLTLREAAHGTTRLFTNLMEQPAFYRLLLFLVLIAFIKLVYKQMDYVYPIFGIRVLGPDAPVGILWEMNTSYIILLAPLVGVLTQKYSAYRMVTVGAVIVSASVFIMALPPAWFQSVADGLPGRAIGHGILGLSGAIDPYYVTIALFVLVYSIGEAFYSPRVYEYAAAIAPKGQEASYAALSYIPFLLSKLLIGIFSGELLMRYCPEVGPRHPQTLWLVVGISSLIAPVGLILLRRVIRLPEAGRTSGAD